MLIPPQQQLHERASVLRCKSCQQPTCTLRTENIPNEILINQYFFFLHVCNHVHKHLTQSDKLDILNSASNVLPHFVQSGSTAFVTSVFHPRARYKCWSRCSAQRDLLLTQTGVDDGQSGMQWLWPILNKWLHQFRRNISENHCNMRMWNRLHAFVYFTVSNWNGTLRHVRKN